MSLEQTAKRGLLRVIDAYQARKPVTDGVLSKTIYGASWFIKELRFDAGGGKGKTSRATSPSFGLRKYDEMIGWFESNWPVGSVWPSDVPHDGKLKLVPVEAGRKQQRTDDGKEKGGSKVSEKGKAKGGRKRAA